MSIKNKIRPVLTEAAKKKSIKLYRAALAAGADFMSYPDGWSKAAEIEKQLKAQAIKLGYAYMLKGKFRWRDKVTASKSKDVKYVYERMLGVFTTRILKRHNLNFEQKIEEITYAAQDLKLINN